MKIRYIGLLILAVTVTACNANPSGVTSSNLPTPVQPIATGTAQSTPVQVVTPTSLSSTVSTATPVVNNVDAFQTQVAVLNEKINTLTTILYFLLAIIGVGGTVSIIGFFRVESRAAEAHSVAMAGERASQDRTAEVHTTFLAGSKNTLELVNATLELAKEASERAAKVIEEKARGNLRDLDNRARDLIFMSGSFQDDKALIGNPDRRSHLTSLARKIEGFEINQYILPIDIALTSYCLFIRAMDYHLNQQFEDAFEYWRRVAVSEGSDRQLRSLARYWIGYENNNLGQFSDGYSNLESAKVDATGARSYELDRLLIETRFFEGRQETVTLIPALEDLLSSIKREVSSDDFEKTRRRILNTLGNVCYVAGQEFDKKKDETRAQEMYEKAKGQFDSAIQDKWAPFGLAEALYRLGQREKAERIYLDQVRRTSHDEYVNREEPRTKAMAKSTELICCVRVQDWADEALAMYNQAVDAVGRVDERLTIFSQIQRRNVKKDVFRKELGDLLATVSK